MSTNRTIPSHEEALSVSKSAKAAASILLRSLGFLFATGIALNFGWHAWLADYRTIGLVGAAVGIGYALLLFARGSHSTDNHNFFRLFPTLLYAALLAVGMSFHYQPETPKYQTVRGEKSWKDDTFSIHGASPGMTREQIAERLGEPTGKTWDTQPKIQRMSAYQCYILANLAADGKAQEHFVADSELSAKTYIQLLKEKFPNGKYPGEVTWLDHPAGRSDFEKMLEQGNCLVTTVQAGSHSPELNKALQSLIDSDAEELRFLRLENPKSKSPQEAAFGHGWTVRRYPLLTFATPGVALDYVQGKNQVDSVHGDELTYKSKVVLRAGDSLDGLPPDWPKPVFRETRLFTADNTLLEETIRVADLKVSNNRIQAHLKAGKVIRISVFHTHYGS